MTLPWVCGARSSPLPPPSPSLRRAAKRSDAKASDTVATEAVAPPPSPFGLLEELVWRDPWLLLLACLLLSVCPRHQVCVISG